MAKALLIIGRRWLFRLVVLAIILGAAFWFTTYHPEDFTVQDVACPSSAPALDKSQELSVMTWNVQFFAGSGYVFWHDVPGGGGSDQGPSGAAMTMTIEDAAEFIDNVNPDVLLLQEVDDNAKRTGSVDQLSALQAELEERYVCSASALYWSSVFVPYSDVRGKVGTKLSVLSRYRISDAVRHQIPANGNIFAGSYNPFELARNGYGPQYAVLEIRMPVVNGESLAVLTTDLDLYEHADSLIERVDRVEHIVSGLDLASVPWVMGGDFNLLPNEQQYDDLPLEHQKWYTPDSDIVEFDYARFPSGDQTSGSDRSSFFTFFSNDPAIDGPDRTLDYVFVSETVELVSGQVLTSGSAGLSDHLPVFVTIAVPDI